MKTIRILIFSLLLFSLKMKCQTVYPTNVEDNDLFFMLSNDTMNVLITPFPNNPSDIFVSNVCHVVSVTIVPTTHNSITIIPVNGSGTVIDSAVSGPVDVTLGGGGGTTVKSRPIGISPGNGGRMRNTNYGIFPNPVTEDLRLYGITGEIISFSIYDFTGKNVSNKAYLNKEGSTINVSNLPKGNYVLKLETTDNQLVKMKFVRN